MQIETIAHTPAHAVQLVAAHLSDQLDRRAAESFDHRTAYVAFDLSYYTNLVHITADMETVNGETRANVLITINSAGYLFPAKFDWRTPVMVLVSYARAMVEAV